MASWLIEWKSDTETQWLKEAPSQPRNSHQRFGTGLQEFFQKCTAFPRFKKRGKMTQGVKLDQSSIFPVMDAATVVKSGLLMGGTSAFRPEYEAKNGINLSRA